MTSLFSKPKRLKTAGQYSKASRIPLNGALNALTRTRPNFDGALLNFRIFLELGPQVFQGLVPPALSISTALVNIYILELQYLEYNGRLSASRLLIIQSGHLQSKLFLISTMHALVLGVSID